MFYYAGNSYDQYPLNHKVTFDGEKKQIVVNYGVSAIDVKRDIYSDWKEWALLRENTKFAPAIRTIGGDPIAPGLFAGDTYFLTNAWQVVIPHSVDVTGVLYHDDAITLGLKPYIVLDGGGVQSTVSNLVQTVVVTETVIAPGPTATAIATAVRSELGPELAKINSQIDGLTPSQATMLSEIYAIYGLDPTKPLVVSDTNRSAGTINQNISSGATSTTIQRL